MAAVHAVSGMDVVALTAAAFLPLVIVLACTRMCPHAAAMWLCPCGRSRGDGVRDATKRDAGTSSLKDCSQLPGLSGSEMQRLFRSDLRELAFESVVRRFGRTARMDGHTITCDPALVRTVLMSRAHSLPRSWVYRLLAWLLPHSDGVLFMEGDAWRVRHREFTPLFAGGALRHYTLAMFMSAVVEAHAHVDALSPSTGTPLSRGSHSGTDLLALLRWSTVRMLLAWGFGLPALDADIDAHTCELGRLLDHYARTCFDEMPRAQPPVLGQLYCIAKLWWIAGRLQRHVETLLSSDAFSHDNSNAALRSADGASEGERPHTFVSRMRGAGFTVPEITSEINHIHGAHKAAAFVTACTLFELSVPAHAHWRRAVKEELVRAFGQPTTRSLPELLAQARCAIPRHIAETLYSAPAAASAASDGPAVLSSGAAGASTASDVSASDATEGAVASLPPPAELPYGWRPPERADIERHLRLDDPSALLRTTCRVWRESLRRHVVSMGVMRRLGEPLEFDGVAYPAGHEMQLWLHALHTLPEHWGSDAHDWNPDRWLSGADNGMQVPNAFFPFLAGMRRCAGMYLAEIEFITLMYVHLVVFDTRVEMPDVSSATTTIIPNGRGSFMIRKAAEMFSALDGPLPYRTKLNDA